MSVPMSLDCDAEADKEDEGAWVMETSAATAAASAMVQDPDPNAFFGNISDPFPPDIALEGQPEVEMELPEAFSIQEFLEKPDEFRPQKTFLTEYIEVKNNPLFSNIVGAPKSTNLLCPFPPLPAIGRDGPYGGDQSPE